MNKKIIFSILCVALFLPEITTAQTIEHNTYKLKIVNNNKVVLNKVFTLISGKKADFSVIKHITFNKYPYPASYPTKIGFQGELIKSLNNKNIVKIEFVHIRILKEDTLSFHALKVKSFQTSVQNYKFNANFKNFGFVMFKNKTDKNDHIQVSLKQLM